MSSLDHVRWLGGGSGAGKSTVAQALADRFGARLYSTDAMMGVHADRLSPDAAPLLERFRQLDMDERWVQRDPTTMFQTFPWFQGEGFDLVVDDLRRLPSDRLIIVEGFRLLPRSVLPHLSDPRWAVWLLPTPAFREASFAKRGLADAFWLNTRHPERALANLLERDRIFTNWLSREAERTGVSVLHVDGTRSIDSMAEDLAERFGLSC
ncbi:hypothetical protein [Ornithinimicrobium cryptoxanthini]|uniref:Uncharacterized protein n=1 Tax=Ornithinimicrobium cryptoxanthini TaxID=2934161 RepID=A0ABY4YGZ6_9MICO|nr:hypothetical protein [Ornithinimicrobium cryptoxanthini]USQ76048.1 hypothetical protein NF557_15865 [Ornithinimicrobium cryptoxanthini]